MHQERKSAENEQRKNFETEDQNFEKKCDAVKKQLKRIKDSKRIESRILKIKFTV